MSGHVYHLECPSGIAGDMFLGACLDLGMPLEIIVDAVRSLGIEDIEVEHRRSQRGGITGSRFRVLVGGQPVEGPDPEEAGDLSAQSHAHPHSHSHSDHSASLHPSTDGTSSEPHAGAHRREVRHAPHLPNSYKGISELVSGSSLPSAVRDRALRMLRSVGEAEARVHGGDLESVHFHELAAIDSIVDIVGAAAAIEYLDARRVTCGQVVVGQGTVRTAHGVMPVPAPATQLLLRGVPTIGGGEGELVTPTGALILGELVDAYGAQPQMRVDSVGYGLGRKQLADRSNSVRVCRGTDASAGLESGRTAEVTVIECQVDDVTGEEIGYATERLLEAGALDVLCIPVQMKKGRPGHLITVLCRHRDRSGLADLLLEETGALGCRFTVAERLESERFWETVETPFGPVRVKIGRLHGRRMAAQPEYEDCRQLAKAAEASFRDVFRAAVRAATSEDRPDHDV